MVDVIERSKSGRAACRSCKNKIDKDIPRYGIESNFITSEDELLTSIHWYHIECAARNYPSRLIFAKINVELSSYYQNIVNDTRKKFNEVLEIGDFIQNVIINLKLNRIEDYTQNKNLLIKNLPENTLGVHFSNQYVLYKFRSQISMSFINFEANVLDVFISIIKQELSDNFAFNFKFVNSKIPDSICEFRLIKLLIRVYPWKISVLEIPSLRSLYLSTNQLTSLPELNLPNLSYLNLSNNQLTSLPELNLPNLNYLNLSNNQLTSLPELNLPNLRSLYLSNNQLESLPKALISLSNLRVLSLLQNPKLYGLSKRYFGSNLVKELELEFGREFPQTPANKDPIRQNYISNKKVLKEITEICSFPSCDRKDKLEAAHIRGRNPGSEGYAPRQRSVDNRSPQNLILLCKPHHQHFDIKNKLHPNKRLRYLTFLKHTHENLERIRRGDIIPRDHQVKIPNFLKNEILNAKKENYSHVFINYPYIQKLEDRMKNINDRTSRSDLLDIYRDQIQFCLGYILDDLLLKTKIVNLRHLPRYGTQQRLREKFDGKTFTKIKGEGLTHIESQEEDVHHHKRLNTERAKFLKSLGDMNQYTTLERRDQFYKKFDEIDSTYWNIANDLQDDIDEITLIHSGRKTPIVRICKELNLEIEIRIDKKYKIPLLIIPRNYLLKKFELDHHLL
ncbi:MAG: leucine-rich repeat domain-containing protein [Candidatus Heimdallarchaeota archaeon]|nr:leucine-rich repeat domain-containing protein [Candidatus Heimdallarchaeota archaeon]